MAVTRLVRKAKKNRTVSKKRIAAIKRLTNRPVIKNVDIEQIKEEFAKNNKKPAAKKEAEKAEVAETPKAEQKAEKPAKAPKAEKEDSDSAE